MRLGDVTELMHYRVNACVAGIDNFKKQGFYVRGRVHDDHTSQRRMCNKCAFERISYRLHDVCAAGGGHIDHL